METLSVTSFTILKLTTPYFFHVAPKLSTSSVSQISTNAKEKFFIQRTLSATLCLHYRRQYIVIALVIDLISHAVCLHYRRQYIVIALLHSFAK